MATNYPGAVDSLTNPAAGEALNSPSHAAQHANANDAIEAVQTEATVAARLDKIEDGTRLGTGSVTSTHILNGTIVDADINASAAIAATKISGTALVASTVDAKGDLYVGTADNAVARLAVGSNGAVLVADSAQTAGVRWTTARRLEGTGAPEGAVTAPPGSTFLQTDSTTDVKGWIRWIKATGTGNTGWVVGPEADTGWREVYSLLDAGTIATAPNNTFRIRRQGNVVHLRVGDITFNSTASTTTVYTFPAGFTPTTSLRVYVELWSLTGGDTTRYTLSFDGSVNAIVQKFARTALSGNARVGGHGMFTTDSSWPSSLPGVAA